MKRGTKTALWIVPLAIVFGVIVAPVNEPGAEDYRGKITAIDRGANSITMDTAAGPMTFAVSDRTLLASGNRSRGASFDHLAVGQDVIVRADEDDESSHRVAASVEIADSAALIGQLEEFPAVAAADTVTIVRTDPASRAIDVETRQGPRRYRIEDETRIRTRSAPIGLGDLEPGQRIAVSAKGDGDAFVATDIVVVAVGAEPPPAPAPKENR